jgi:hypothetical protein
LSIHQVLRPLVESGTHGIVRKEARSVVETLLARMVALGDDSAALFGIFQRCSRSGLRGARPGMNG